MIWLCACRGRGGVLAHSKHNPLTFSICAARLFCSCLRLTHRPLSRHSILITEWTCKAAICDFRQSALPSGCLRLIVMWLCAGRFDCLYQFEMLYQREVGLIAVVPPCATRRFFDSCGICPSYCVLRASSTASSRASSGSDTGGSIPSRRAANRATAAF